MTSSNRLTDSEISDILSGNGFLHLAHVSDLRTFRDMMPHLKRDRIPQLTSSLKDHPVIELGYGVSPLHEIIECGSYIGVDPFVDPRFALRARNARYVDEDALTFLRKQPTRSSIIASFGMMDRSVLNTADQKHPKIKKLEQYSEELSESIRRVAHPFALLYGSDTGRILGKPDIPIIPSNENAGGFYFFRKS